MDSAVGHHRIKDVAFILFWFELLETMPKFYLFNPECPCRSTENKAKLMISSRKNRLYTEIW